MSLLTIEQLSAGYNGRTIIDKVNLSVPKEKIVAIIGPNGAGKSTLMKAIFGLIRPFSGTVWFDGQNVTGLAPREILQKGMAYVAQSKFLFPRMTVDENLQVATITLRATIQEETVNKMYKMFPQLLEFKNHLAYTLSGGQQRTLELARALLLQPKLMMLDEPSIGLSPVMIRQIYTEIKGMAEHGMTLLIVEQNVRKALEASDFVYILDQGRNAFSGTRDEILESDALRSIYVGNY